jgi:hypothetical protein
MRRRMGRFYHPSALAWEAKGGGVDPKVFEGDALVGHLAVHEAARTLRDAVEAESAEMLSLLGDLAIHRGVLTRPVLLSG